MGRNLAELEALVEVCPQPCGLCLDTAHLFASGNPVHRPEGLEQLVSNLETRDLLPLLKLIHLNDSRTPFASGRDHHENLGLGQLGYEALGRVIRHPAFDAIPFVLEVPGLDGHGPDAFSIETATAMRRGAPAPPVPPAPSA
jgi:deoxyribonuclease-4